jgi:hypothetical protein
MFNEHHLKFGLKIKEKMLYLFLKTGYTKVTCHADESLRASFHLKMTTCTNGIKLNYIDLKRVVDTKVKTKLSLMKYKEVSVQYQSKGIDFKAIGGVLFIMMLMGGLLMVMSKRGNSRKSARLRYKELSKNK